MRNGINIRYLQNNEIDRGVWDECINRSSNGLIYAYSAYLDGMAEQWDALVLGNYEAVMPLPWKKKYFIHYIYQPPLTAQLGLFANDITPTLLQNFLDAIPPKFRYWEFSLNHSNLFAIDGYNLFERMNYVLDLRPSYEQLSSSYRENTKRNIRKAKDFGCRSKTGVPVDDVIELAKLQAKEFNETDWQRFRKLYTLMDQQGMAKTYGVYSVQEELMASCVFFFSHGRASYILVGNHPNGRTLGASHMLIDAFIRDNAGQNLILDFEGSDFRNLAFFYSSFGSAEEKYPAIRLNRLPEWAKWLKK